MKSLLILILLFLMNFICSGQKENEIIFYNLKDSTKFRTYKLPVEAIIKEKDSVNGKPVLIVDIQDSSIIALEHIWTNLSVNEEKKTKLLEKLYKEQIQINKDKKIKKKVRKVMLDSLSKFYYLDTLKFNISNLKKIRIEKENPSKLALYSSVTLNSISGMMYLVGFLGSINDSTMNPDKEKRQQNVIIAVGGLVGMAACLTWMHYIRFKQFYLTKWNVGTNRREDN